MAGHFLNGVNLYSFYAFSLRSCAPRRDERDSGGDEAVEEPPRGGGVGRRVGGAERRGELDPRRQWWRHRFRLQDLLLGHGLSRDEPDHGDVTLYLRHAFALSNVRRQADRRRDQGEVGPAEGADREFPIEMRQR